MSTPIAVSAALTAALLFGISSVADQQSTKRVRSRRPLSPLILADLVRQPLWLTAIATNVAGFALQVVALASGSLALVQPLLVCDLVFAVLISWYLGRRAGIQRSGAKLMFAGVAATTAGVAGFLAIGRPSGGSTRVGIGVLPPLAVGLVVVVGGCLAVAARNRTLRPLALALGCGVCYGVAAFAIKLVTAESGGGLPQILSNWPIYVLAVAGRPASCSTRMPSSRARCWLRSRRSSPQPTPSSPSPSASAGCTSSCAAPPRTSSARSYRSCS